MSEFIARKGLIALADSQITGSLNISQNLNVVGGLTASFDSSTSTAISGAFDSVSSSLAQRLSDQESYSSSYAPTLHTTTTNGALTPNTIGVGGLNVNVGEDTPLYTSTSPNTANLYIGDSSKGYAGYLSVDGTANITGDVTVGGTITAQEFHTEYVSGSIIYTSGSTKFGDSVDDTHEFTGSIKTYGGDGLFLTSTAGDTGNIFVSPSVHGMYMDFPSSYYLAFRGSSEFMRINSSGNVGINEANAESLLHLKGSVNQTGITLENPQSRKYQIFSNGSTGGGGASTGNFAVYDATASTDRLVIDSVGSIGFGTDTSSWGGGYKGYEFGYKGSGFFPVNASSLQLALNYYYDGTNYVYANDGVAKRISLYNGGIAFYSAPSGTAGNTVTLSNQLLIDSNGNVGINTSGPSDLLHIHRSAGDTRLVRTYLPDNTVYNAGSYNTEEKVAAGLRFQWYTDYWQIGAARGGSYDVDGFIFSRNGSEVLVLNESGNVGVGTVSPMSKLMVKGGLSGHDNSNYISSPMTVVSEEYTDSAYHSILQLVAVRQSLTTGNAANGYLGFSTIDDSNNQGQQDAGRIAIVNEAGSSRNSSTALSFWTNPGGTQTTPATEKMRILSSGGITFNGDTAAANALDDYEEGTWTPSYYGDSTAGSVTYNGRGGTYTKIGNQVTVWFSILNFSVTGAAGNLIIGGLPFTPNFTNSVRGAFSGNIRTYNVDWPDGYSNLLINLGNADSYMSIMMIRDNNTWANLQVENGSNQYIEGYVTYTV